jgi:glycosyltransferase involved in cell wall biosynthesis
MRIIQVVPRISDEASGPSYTVPSLTSGLAKIGASVELHVLSAGEQESTEYQVESHPTSRFFSRLGISHSMGKTLRRKATTANILHNHSLWMMPNVYSGRAVRNTDCRLVVSPRGTLSQRALQQSYWPKRIMWRLCQHDAVRQAACLHATAEHEYLDIRRAGFRQPVAIIPNGIDVPADPRAEPCGRRTLLFLGRIHPIKGLEGLLRAWQSVQRSFPDWEIQIVGPGDSSYTASLKRLAVELNLERTGFVGPAYGKEKQAWYRRAELSVLPSWSENFGMSVSESLSHGLPAIATDATPWSGMSTHRCGWWIETGESALTDCLQKSLCKTRSELAEMGQRGRRWMEEEFAWPRISSMMFGTYEWLLGGGTPPAWIATD